MKEKYRLSKRNSNGYDSSNCRFGVKNLFPASRAGISLRDWQSAAF
jgi:hypothetical protein